MAGNLTPNQMFTHEFNAVKGYVDQHAVDKTAAPADQVTFNRGVTLHLNTDGDWELGVTGTQMGCWAMQGSDEYDANSDVGNMSGGRVSALVAAGAYELETSAFDEQEGGYDPNTPLRAGVDGLLEEGTVYEDAIVGVTSDGVITNEYGVDVLRFWPVYLPQDGR